MRIAYVTALASALGLMVAGVWVGCSSSDNGGAASNDGGGVDQFVPPNGDDSGNPGNDSGPPGDDGSTIDSGDAGPALSCTDYCTTILANCGAVPDPNADAGDAGDTSNAQYYNTADCMSTCALFAQGTFGDSTNSLGCRQYHAHLASTAPAVHCPHAGAGGGALCGTRCDDYCSLAMAHCSTANGADPPYASLSDCMSACAAYPYDIDGGDYDPNAIGTLNCLDYHLRESFSDLGGQGIDGGHCDDLSIDGGTTRGACHP